jgi:hypothetical protein
MLEIIGFCALAYLIFKFAPVVLEMGFKFAVICLGLVAFLFLVSWIWGTLVVTFAGI